MLGLECWDGCVSGLCCPGAKLRPRPLCCWVRPCMWPGTVSKSQEGQEGCWYSQRSLGRAPAPRRAGGKTRPGSADPSCPCLRVRSFFLSEPSGSVRCPVGGEKAGTL